MADATSVRITITADDEGVRRVFASIADESEVTKERIKANTREESEDLDKVRLKADETHESMGRLGDSSDRAHSSIGKLITSLKWGGIGTLGSFGLAGAGLGLAGAGVGALGYAGYQSVSAASRAKDPGAMAAMRSVQGLTRALQGAEVSFGKSFAPILGSFAKGLDGFVPKISAVLAPLGQSLSGVVGPLTTALGGFAVSFTKEFVGIAPLLTKALTGAMPMISTVFKSTFGLLSSVLRVLLPPVEAAIRAWFPALVGILNAVMPSLSKVLWAVIPPVTVFLRGVGSVLGALLPPLASAITSFMPLLTSGLRATIPFLTSMLHTVLPPLARAIRAIMPSLEKAINKIMPPLERALQKFMPVLSSALTQLLPPLSKAIITAMPPLTSIMVKLLPVISKFISLAGSLTTNSLVGHGSHGVGGVLKDLTIGSRTEKLSPLWFWAKATGHAHGGPIGIAGGYGGGDRRPLLGEDGEYVLRKEAVAGIGVQTANQINQTGRLPAGGGGPSTINLHLDGDIRMDGTKVAKVVYRAALKQNSLSGAWAPAG